MNFITNEEIVEEMYAFIKDSNSIKDFIKEYGGGTVYIPSYKTIFRDEDIKNDYIEMKKNKETKIAFKLARKYEVTERQIYDITKTLR